MYYNKVEICGVNTAKLPVLKEKEKRELLERIQKGDEEARQTMIQGNLRLVLSVVQKFANRGEAMDDLFQVGCIGLIKAIDHFDPSLNVRWCGTWPTGPCRPGNSSRKAWGGNPASGRWPGRWACPGRK